MLRFTRHAREKIRTELWKFGIDEGLVMSTHPNYPRGFSQQNRQQYGNSKCVSTFELCFEIGDIFFALRSSQQQKLMPHIVSIEGNLHFLFIRPIIRIVRTNEIS